VYRLPLRPKNRHTNRVIYLHLIFGSMLFLLSRTASYFCIFISWKVTLGAESLILSAKKWWAHESSRMFAIIDDFSPTFKDSFPLLQGTHQKRAHFGEFSIRCTTTIYLCKMGDNGCSDSRINLGGYGVCVGSRQVLAPSGFAIA